MKLDIIPKQVIIPLRFAEQRLEGVLDKAGNHIYHHLLSVLNIFRGSHDYTTPEADIVCVLHEVIEDGGVTVEELRERFGNEVAEAVDAISRRDGESYMTYIKRCSLNKTAREVKIADLKDNMDITRLKKITDEDLQRLKKYHKAYRYLVELPDDGDKQNNYDTRKIPKAGHEDMPAHLQQLFLHDDEPRRRGRRTGLEGRKDNPKR